MSKFRLLDTRRMLKNEPHPFVGFIYAIGGEHGPVKIGWTGKREIKGRLISCQTGNPVELHVLARREGTQDDEARVHRQLRQYRVRGEWFERTPALALFNVVLEPGGKQPAESSLNAESLLYDLRLRYQKLDGEHQAVVAELANAQRRERVAIEETAEIRALYSAQRDLALELKHDLEIARWRLDNPWRGQRVA